MNPQSCCWSDPRAKASLGQCNRFVTTSSQLRYFLRLLQTYQAAENNHPVHTNLMQPTAHFYPASNTQNSRRGGIIAYRQCWHEAALCPGTAKDRACEPWYRAEESSRTLLLCYAYYLNNRFWYPVSYSTGTGGGSFPRRKAAGAWSWPPHLVPRLRMRGTVLPLRVCLHAVQTDKLIHFTRSYAWYYLDVC